MLKAMFEIIATMANDPEGISLGYEDEIAGDSGYHAIGPDGRGARKEGPCLRQGDRRQSLDQPASQLVAAGAALEDEKRRMGRASAETIRQPRERRTGQPQERQHSADAERGGTRDRLQSRDRLTRHPNAGQ